MKKIKNVEDVLNAYFCSYDARDIIDDWIDEKSDLYYFEYNENGEYKYVYPSKILKQFYPLVYQQKTNEWAMNDTKYITIKNQTWLRSDYNKVIKILEIHKQLDNKKNIEDKEKELKNKMSSCKCGFVDLSTVLNKCNRERNIENIKKTVESMKQKAKEQRNKDKQNVLHKKIDDIKKNYKYEPKEDKPYFNIYNIINELDKQQYPFDDVFDEEDINEAYKNIFDFLTGKK